MSHFRNLLNLSIDPRWSEAGRPRWGRRRRPRRRWRLRASPGHQPPRRRGRKPTARRRRRRFKQRRLGLKIIFKKYFSRKRKTTKKFILIIDCRVCGQTSHLDSVLIIELVDFKKWLKIKTKKMLDHFFIFLIHSSRFIFFYFEKKCLYFCCTKSCIVWIIC